MNKINNAEPYQFNEVATTWLTPEKNAIGTFVSFNINTGDLVTHEFKKGGEEEPDTLIYHIKNNSYSNLAEVTKYTNSSFAQTDNLKGLMIQLFVNDIVPPGLPPAPKLCYILGYNNNNNEAYDINYLSTPYGDFDGINVYVIINLMIFEGDIVCGSAFKSGGTSSHDEFTVNIISNKNNITPLIPYVGTFGPFLTKSWGIGVNTLVNGNPPASKPIGIKSYGSDTDKQHSKQPN